MRMEKVDVTDEVDPSVLEQARRRAADMKSGRVRGIPAAEVLDELDRMAL